MPEVLDTRESLRQNLVDAGCGEELIGRCMELAREGKTAQVRQLLAYHRQRLLDGIHQGEERIDCLDYLLYQMEKQSRKKDK